MIPTLDVKYAYSMCLGMLIALTGVSLWQRFVPSPARDVTENVEAVKVIVPPLPTTFTRPSLNDGENIGSLRVGNRTDRSVRIVLFSRVTSQNVWKAIEPLNWDFAPNEGGKEGLLLSLPNYKIAIGKEEPGNGEVATKNKNQQWPGEKMIAVGQSKVGIELNQRTGHSSI